MKKTLSMVMLVLLGLVWYVTLSSWIGNDEKYRNMIAEAQRLEQKGLYLDAVAQYEEARKIKGDTLELKGMIADDYLAMGDYKAYRNQLTQMIAVYGPVESSIVKLYEFTEAYFSEDTVIDLVEDWREKYPDNETVLKYYDGVKGKFTERLCAYDKIGDFAGGFAVYTQGGKKGLIDLEGTPVIEAVYDEIAFDGKDRERISVKDGQACFFVMAKYVSDLPKQEVVSLTTFGEEIQFLCEKSQDAESLLSQIDGVEFQNQNTYLTDYLYQTLDDIGNDPVFTRFLVISDGVDNKTIGITKEELHDKLKQIPRPVYTIGHIYKDNAAELKNMFALSRLTGGKEFLVEDFEDPLSIADKVHDFSALYSCRMKIPQDIMDGANRHVLLKLRTQKGDMEVMGEAPMPFGLIEESKEETAPVEEAASVKAQKTVPSPEPKPAEEPVSPQEAPDPPAKAVDENAQPADRRMEILVAVPVIILAAFFLYGQRKKTKKKQKKIKNRSPKIPVEVKEKKRPEAAVLPRTPGPVRETDENETVLLDRRYLLVLRDQANLEKVFRYPLDRPVIVGRNVDRVQIAVDYSLTVSGQHCEFSVKNNHFFIRDLNSANHTFLNGAQIKGEREIVSGNLVRLGEVEFCVEIIPL